jgi:hypothetical protein
MFGLVIFAAIFALSHPSRHLIYSFEVTSPAFLAAFFAFGLPPIIHHPAEAAHGVQSNGRRFRGLASFVYLKYSHKSMYDCVVM